MHIWSTPPLQVWKTKQKDWVSPILLHHAASVTHAFFAKCFSWSPVDVMLLYWSRHDLIWCHWTLPLYLHWRQCCNCHSGCMSQLACISMSSVCIWIPSLHLTLTAQLIYMLSGPTSQVSSAIKYTNPRPNKQSSASSLCAIGLFLRSMIWEGINNGGFKQSRALFSDHYCFMHTHQIRSCSRGYIREAKHDCNWFSTRPP